MSGRTSSGKDACCRNGGVEDGVVSSWRGVDVHTEWVCGKFGEGAGSSLSVLEKD